ncbi:MAG: tRNA 2-selenouridine(34) synthase MnmH [Cyclobacteriaceae bacterium]|nr:tRNA 2-selenouridine(34) synthase MnmH [Cyclobacteriaceae bacterium]MCK5702119.1 tRNA 2-selenouridine(34) synthase MnmH [Cyclobacteriaceae bacterium]
MRRVEVKDFLLLEKNTPVVDVRSPAEYAEGHIAGALNLPLFSNEERARVGTAYTQVGKGKALELGLEIVGPKMISLAKKAKAIGLAGKLKTHCWRGGLRSDKMAWLFELVGLDVTILDGGYKAFRQQLLEDFRNIENLIVLQGPTGSGKTAILQELEENDEQILDLEKRANHKGSAFGAIGMGKQPSTAQFQNWLYDDLLKLDSSKRIWIESESLSIGRVYLPETLWKTMNNSNIVEINMDKTIRAKRIVEEYGRFEPDQLEASIEKIKNRFGGGRVKKALELLHDQKLEEVVMLLLDYYDKGYSFSKNKYKKKEAAILEATSGYPSKNAIELIRIADNLNL